jgi:proline dehydrogenase
MVKKKPSEIDQRKEIMDLQAKYDFEKHERVMVELNFRRDTEAIHHDHEMERQRIKSAEIRKAMERKELANKFKY